MMTRITPLLPGADDEVTQLLRGALHAEASGVNPPDRFDDLLALLDAAEPQELPRGRRTFRWVAAAGIAVAAFGVSVPLILNETVDPASVEPTIATPAAPTPTPVASAPVSLPGNLQAVPVYYVGQDGLLYREFRSLTGDDTLASAVNALLNVDPLDPDYASRWAPGQVLSARVEGNLITVDLSESAFAAFTDAAGARAAVDQLVYTATAVVGDPEGVLSLEVLSAGRAELPVLGTPDSPFSRDGVNPLGFVWVTAPQNQAELAAGPVTVSGDVRSGLGQVDVEVRDASGALVSTTGATLGGAVGSWQPYEATVALSPGTWTLVVAVDGHAESKVVVVS